MGLSRGHLPMLQSRLSQASQERGTYGFARAPLSDLTLLQTSRGGFAPRTPSPTRDAAPARPLMWHTSPHARSGGEIAPGHGAPAATVGAVGVGRASVQPQPRRALPGPRNAPAGSRGASPHTPNAQSHGHGLGPGAAALLGHRQGGALGPLPTWPWVARPGGRSTRLIACDGPDHTVRPGGAAGGLGGPGLERFCEAGLCCCQVLESALVVLARALPPLSGSAGDVPVRAVVRYRCLERAAGFGEGLHRGAHLLELLTEVASSSGVAALRRSPRRSPLAPRGWDEEGRHPHAPVRNATSITSAQARTATPTARPSRGRKASQRHPMARQNGLELQSA